MYCTQLNGYATWIINGNNTNSNQITYYYFHQMGLGDKLTTCSLIGIPDGWTQTSFFGVSSNCPNLGYSIPIQHTSCVSGDTNCSWPQPAGSITASPSNVYIPYGQNGSTTLTFSSDNITGGTCWWVSVDGAAATNGPCYTGNQSSRTELIPWIQAGHQYVFYLYEESAHIFLGQVTVNGISDGTPTISVSPNPVVIPAGQPSAPMTISWNAPGYSAVSLYGSNSLPPYNGAILCLGSGFAASDSINGHTYPGEVAHLYIVASDGCTAGATVSSVPGFVLADVGFSAQ